MMRHGSVIAVAVLCASCATHPTILTKNAHQPLAVAHMSRPTTRSSPLIDAIVDRHDALALRLISEGANLEATDEHGSTALWFAVNAGTPNMDIVRALVEHGANVNARCIGGATPLHGAAEFGTPEVVRYLIDHGADPLARDDCGDTPASYAKSAAGLQPNEQEVLSALAHRPSTTP